MNINELINKYIIEYKYTNKYTNKEIKYIYTKKKIDTIVSLYCNCIRLNPFSKRLGRV